MDSNHRAFTSAGATSLHEVRAKGVSADATPVGSFLSMDPPAHDAQRKIVTPALAPSNLVKFQDLIRERTRRVLGTLPSKRAEPSTLLTRRLPCPRWKPPSIITYPGSMVIAAARRHARLAMSSWTMRGARKWAGQARTRRRCSNSRNGLRRTAGWPARSTSSLTGTGWSCACPLPSSERRASKPIGVTFAIRSGRRIGRERSRPQEPRAS